MALTKRQQMGMLKIFAKGYLCSETFEERKVMLRDTLDLFNCDIKNIADEMRMALAENGASELQLNEFETMLEGKEKSKLCEECEICDLSLEDEDQIVRLILNELNSPFHLSAYDVGTVKDFMNTGYSFVAKHGDEVVGVVFAQKIFNYGSCDIFLSIFAVNHESQGQGIGHMMMDHLKNLARKDRIYHIRLFTRRSLPAYHIYQHLNFEDDGNYDETYMRGFTFS